MDTTRHRKAWLILGYLVFVGVFMAIAYWKHWTKLTDGPRPLGIIISGGAYWGVVGYIWLLRGASTSAGRTSAETAGHAVGSISEGLSEEGGSTPKQ